MSAGKDEEEVREEGREKRLKPVRRDQGI